jgi:hypothetical protein
MFPQALNECYAVYQWLHDPENLRKLGIPIGNKQISGLSQKRL